MAESLRFLLAGVVLVEVVLVEDNALDCLLSSGLLNIAESSLDNLD